MATREPCCLRKSSAWPHRKYSKLPGTIFEVQRAFAAARASSTMAVRASGEGPPFSTLVRLLTAACQRIRERQGLGPLATLRLTRTASNFALLTALKLRTTFAAEATTALIPQLLLWCFMPVGTVGGAGACALSAVGVGEGIAVPSAVEEEGGDDSKGSAEFTQAVAVDRVEGVEGTSMGEGAAGACSAVAVGSAGVGEGTAILSTAEEEEWGAFAESAVSTSAVMVDRVEGVPVTATDKGLGLGAAGVCLGAGAAFALD